MFDPAGLGKKAQINNLLIRQLTSLLYTHAGNSIVIPAQDCWDRCCPQGHCKSGQRCWRNGGLLGRERVRAGPGCPVTPNHKQIHLTLPVEHARPRRLTMVAPKSPFTPLLRRWEKSSLTCKHVAFVTPKRTNQFPDSPPRLVAKALRP